VPCFGHPTQRITAVARRLRPDELADLLPSLDKCPHPRKNSEDPGDLVRTWTNLKASNTDAGDLFGAAVEISGDTIVVGPTYEDSGARGLDGDPDAPGGTDSGAVYVFR
jgi:hypothetical protein